MTRLRLAVILSLLAVASLTGCSQPQPRVVLYCAQDQEFAEGILADFTAQTGLAVAPKYDTEATKSVSLSVELVREIGRPRCDVHWNNEILNSIRLQRQGVYEPYESPAAAAFPQSARALDRTWTAFAARARVIVVNTEQVPAAERPRSIFDLTQPKWRGKVALAKPQFGTTATQAACLFEALGSNAAKEFYRGLKANDVQVVAGNKQVAEGVAAGRFALGLTDSDDALAEKLAGKPVELIFPDRDGHPNYPYLGTLFIPNTVAIIRGCPNMVGAQRLVDYLLSPAVEQRLAEGGAHQIPLNPNVKAKLPAGMETPQTVKPMVVNWYGAADLWDESQQFLLEEFAR
jgi:iron(III) transport system substrate-binding protein